jgi:DNA ligase (NAD+)
LINTEINELIEMDDVGEVVAESIYNYFHNDNNIAIVKGLINAGVVINYNKQEIEETMFTGKTVVITGSFDKYSRVELTDKFQKMGAKVASSVSKNTDYVIVGENAGSKYDKAVELGIDIITGEELNNLIKF